MDFFEQYNTPTQAIGRGKVVGSYIERNVTKLGVWEDDIDVQAYIRGLITTGVLTPNSNSYYPIHFNPNITVTAGSETSCVTFAGYHSIFYAADIAQSVTSVPYGVIPDCTNGASLPDLLSPISHELAEAVTDPG
ncbi:hypothetical protein HDU99_005276, partial [Rhizoclosmatium hyalinum]